MIEDLTNFINGLHWVGRWFLEVKEDLMRKSWRERSQSPRKNWEKVKKEKEEKEKVRIDYLILCFM